MDGQAHGTANFLNKRASLAPLDHSLTRIVPLPCQFRRGSVHDLTTLLPILYFVT
jgi:hypothetical protein